MKIEAKATWKVTVYYDTPHTWQVEKAESAAFAFVKSRQTVHILTDCGGPAHGPNIEISGPRRDSVEKVAGMIVRYIRRLKDTKVINIG